MITATKARKRVNRKFTKTHTVTRTDAVLVHIGHRLLNPLNQNIHFGEKKRMKERFSKAVAQTDRPLAVSLITFIRWYPPRSKPFDEGDNLNASFKWFRDAACEWLGLPNDGPACGVAFGYEQHVSDAYGISVVFR